MGAPSSDHAGGPHVLDAVTGPATASTAYSTAIQGAWAVANSPATPNANADTTATADADPSTDAAPNADTFAGTIADAGASADAGACNNAPIAIVTACTRADADGDAARW